MLSKISVIFLISVKVLSSWMSIFLGTVEVLGMFFSAILFNLAVKRAIGSSTPSSLSN